MEKDLFIELGEAAEKAFLVETELDGLSGGEDFRTHNDVRCGFDGANIGYCPGNVCDAHNLGACPVNTSGGGPRTCPLSK